ncbi:MAG: hypothetical protein FWE84_00275 [Firmicutes bacterium]|nr:hypothetical protein [Bacillota bacterium]
MVEVFEISGIRAQECGEKFGFVVNSACRVFVMQENGDIGAGVLMLDGGVVWIKQVVTNSPFAYYDLLARTLLAVVRNMTGMMVRVKKAYENIIKAIDHTCFLQFGFVDCGEYLEILSDDINFCCNQP